MAYVAVKGGREAIDNSIAALKQRRMAVNSEELTLDQISSGMHFLVDRVMSEGSLYAPEIAALAIKQAAGDTFEAAFMLRAYRATLPRLGYSIPAGTEEMRIIRRISAAFKDIPGGQILGPSVDYTLRLLDFTTSEEENGFEKYQTFFKDAGLQSVETKSFKNIIEILRKENMIVSREHLKNTENKIYDITRDSIQFPTKRSASLQTMTRGETGGMLALAYSNMRGYGSTHPTVGELRVGYIPVKIRNTLNGKFSVIGEVLVTEAELISKIRSLSDDQPRFDVGYGICFGHNETKAISMATLDMAMRADAPQHPSENEEFVLSHIDGIESMGFVNHYKLPHYVTFQSELDRLRMSKSRLEPKENCEGVA